jgi:hypothetical protein
MSSVVAIGFLSGVSAESASTAMDELVNSSSIVDLLPDSPLASVQAIVSASL